MGILQDFGRLGKMYISGAVTEEEYEAARAALLSGHPVVLLELLEMAQFRRDKDPNSTNHCP